MVGVVTWRGMGERKTANSLRISGLLWCHQESNRGHKDFQSFALPTELWHRFCLLIGFVSRLRVQSYCLFLNCANFSATFFQKKLKFFVG